MHGQIYDLFGYRVSDLFAPERIWIPMAVCVAAFAVAGIAPSAIFSAVSIDYAFRRGGDNEEVTSLPASDNGCSGCHFPSC